MLKVAVLVSGGGTNLQAIIDGMEDGRITNAKIEVVISSKSSAYALERASRCHIKTECIVPKEYKSLEDFSKELLKIIDSYQVDLIVLAGFLIILPDLIVKKYPNQIINVHPSLLPSFGGAGYYGLKVHEAVLNGGNKVTGATVHFVDEGTDTGPIILQKAVDVLEEDTPKTLQDRVMKQGEWKILPEAINLIANDKITVVDNRVRRKNMKVLIIGSGGREHAIAWKVARSKKVEKIFCAPGNGGMQGVGECVPIPVTNFTKLADFASEKKIDLTVIGPDDPLVLGIVDVFCKRGLRVFGPSKNAAIIEGSKIFAKDLMKKYNIPTAAYESFDNPEGAYRYLEDCNYPIALKADGLAFGKGVLLCDTKEDAVAGVGTIMIEKQFGAAGDRVLIEEFITGREVSVLAFCDGKTIKTMTSAQDHKRAEDGDKGLNTGGMGTFSPSPFYTKEIHEYCEKYIYQPTLDAMRNEGREFVGILFFGLMLTKTGPKVLEYNARFGDPETQVVLPRMKNDIIEVLEACIDGKLDKIHLEFEDNASVCVVLASKGYPSQYEKGFLIKGLEEFEDKDGYYIFHAGTKKTEKGIVTDGGRVLGITTTGASLEEARRNAYEAAKQIEFKNKYQRNDIGKAMKEIIEE